MALWTTGHFIENDLTNREREIQTTIRKQAKEEIENGYGVKMDIKNIRT